MPQNKHLGISITEFDAFDMEWLTLNVDISFELDCNTFDSELLLDEGQEQPVIFNLVTTLFNLVKISSIGGNYYQFLQLNPFLHLMVNYKSIFHATIPYLTILHMVGCVLS